MRQIKEWQEEAEGLDKVILHWRSELLGIAAEPIKYSVDEFTKALNQFSVAVSAKENILQRIERLNLLDAYKLELVEKIGGMNKSFEGLKSEIPKKKWYNQALADILDLIKEGKE